MVKKIVLLFLVGILLTTTIACSTTGGTSNKVIKIGIAQISEHPAMDASRKGFIDALKENGYEEGKNIKFDIQNAQGEMANANAIAKQFASKKLDMIFAIATPTAQAVANSIKDTPILITAVTDPVAAKLVKSMEKPDTNVTGTTDITPVAEQIQIIHRAFPKAKKIGILYNSGEANSIVQVKLAREAAQKLNLELIEATVTNSGEVNQAAQSLVGRTEVFYVPTDNTVASAISAVAKVAISNKIPLVGAEKAHVEGGALFTKGIDYYELGKLTGKMAVEILKGNKKAKDMPVEKSDKLTIAVNENTMKTIGVSLPVEITDNADIIKK